MCICIVCCDSGFCVENILTDPEDTSDSQWQLLDGTAPRQDFRGNKFYNVLLYMTVLALILPHSYWYNTWARPSLLHLVFHITTLIKFNYLIIDQVGAFYMIEEGPE